METKKDLITFTAEIQRDGRIQIPHYLRSKFELNRGDVLELTINKKL